MKKLILVLALALFLFSGCKKDDVLSNDCDDNWGTIVIQNQSNNSYMYFLNGVNEGYVLGNSSKSIKKENGLYKIETVQMEGYLVYPSTFESTIIVQSCDTRFFSFP